ncbi:MAG: LacI family DNA-binding transcriptional regulator [Spirochaetales bacterium]|nr:LacI family DNA-binding transcriptional regulator [Spirochaetales bacterium]
MAVTIREIAEKAGVSRGTVDRALHNREGVNPDVARRIKEIAASMEYLPNTAARALSLHKEPKKIVFILPDTDSTFFSFIQTGLAKAQEEYREMGTLITAVHMNFRNISAVTEQLDSLMSEGIAGLIITGPDVPELREKLNSMAEKGIPFITYNSDIQSDKGLCYVGQDLYKGGKVAADLMHKLTPCPSLVLAVAGKSDFKAHTERITGFVDGMKEYSKDYDIRIIEGYNPYKRDTFSAVLADPEVKQHVKGIFISTGKVAATMEAVKQSGLLGKVRVICNDEIPEVIKGLKKGYIDFTICQDPVNQGYLPVKIMVQHLMGHPSTPDKWIKSPVEIKTVHNID